MDMVLYVVSLGKKINNQDEKARMPVAPRAEGKEPGAGRLCSELHFVWGEIQHHQGVQPCLRYRSDILSKYIC